MNKEVPDEAPLNPAAVPTDQLARILGVAAEAVNGHVRDGCPTNPDGTLHLVTYAAWLNRGAENMTVGD